MDYSRAADGFRNLSVSDWRQFGHLDLDFHPRLTILTGANATGKSTVLSLLARHFNWSRAYSFSRIRGDKRGKWAARNRRRRPVSPETYWESVGSLSYYSGAATVLEIPANSSDERAQYDVNMPQQQMVTGLFLTSHRSPSGNYAPVVTIPALFGSSEQLFEQFTNEVRVRWAGGSTGRSPQLALKEALIAAAVFGGGGNESVETNIHARETWFGFQDVLRNIFPSSLKFLRLRVRVPDVFVETETGDFLIDDASGGLSAIMEMAWQIFLRSSGHSRFTVLIDEPENHLHPKLQRELLPGLLSAFPNVQFIVATHSPFVVTATPESTVYVLDHNNSGRVEARRLDYANKSASAEETLKQVLGLESTMPIWATSKFEQIVDKYLNGHLDKVSIAAMRDELVDNGLEAEFSQALVTLAERAED